MSQDQPVSEARRESTMATARLEHHILQAVIQYTAEHQLSKPEIVLALLNVAGYWQKKIILSAIHREKEQSK